LLSKGGYGGTEARIDLARTASRFWSSGRRDGWHSGLCVGADDPERNPSTKSRGDNLHQDVYRRHLRRLGWLRHENWGTCRRHDPVSSGAAPVAVTP
jgi:hypothetical protein